MEISETKKRLLFVAFAVVDFFAAIEITSFIVASPRVVEYFNVSMDSISWIINSYLYVIFGVLVLLYFASKKIKHTANIKAFFLLGLGLFFLGSVLGAFSTSMQMFYVSRVIQGVGAALSFVGQLWVMTYSFKSEIGKPLFWTEIGAAAGVIVGPFLGGIFSDMSAGGWRYLFVFNAVVVLLAMMLVFFLYHDRPKQVVLSEKKFRKDFYFAMIIIVATIAVAVASEFVVSLFLQQFKNYSGIGAGLVLLSGSLGLVFGSALASKIKTKKQQQIIKGLWGLLFAVLFMGATFFGGLLLLVLAPVSFFIVGFFYGFLSVILYAYISHMLPQNLLVKGIIIYLIALQFGNATGIYVEKIWTFFGYDFFAFTLVVVAGVVVALLFAVQLSNLENIEGDLYEVAPIGKTPFSFSQKLASEIVNLFQAIFYVCIVIPFRLFMNIKVYGIKNVEIGDQVIIVSNHGARLDAWVILAGLGLRNYLKLHPFRIPIDKGIFNIPILKFLFKGIGVYKIESKGDLSKSLEDTLEYMDRGHSILFFPQGHMLKKGETSEPKKGISHIIKHKNIHILPAKIIYRSFNGRNRGAMRGVSVLFGDVVHSEEMKKKHHEDNLHHAIMEYVHKLEIEVDKALHAGLPQFAEIVREFSETDLKSVLDVIRKSFPSYWDSGHEEDFYRKIVGSSENISILLKEGIDVVGCLIAMPHNVAVDNVKIVDFLVKRKKEDFFYVETIAVLPNHRNKFGHFKLLVALVTEAKQRGVYKYSMHIRKENGLSKQIQRIFKREVILVRAMNWKWERGEEDMDYIECAFTRPIVYLHFLFITFRLYMGVRKLHKGIIIFKRKVATVFLKNNEL